MPRLALDPAILHSLESQALMDGVREEWLQQAVTLCHDLFSEEGFALPPVRVSCSFPGGGSARRRIGEGAANAAPAPAISTKSTLAPTSTIPCRFSTC